MSNNIMLTTAGKTHTFLQEIPLWKNLWIMWKTHVFQQLFQNERGT